MNLDKDILPKNNINLEKIINDKKKAILDNLNNINYEDIINFVKILNYHKNNNIFISGIGKSYNTAKQISDLFKSISLSSYDLNIGNLLHGDIGTIKKDDLFIIITKSGKTNEILKIIEYIKCKIIIITNTLIDNIQNFYKKFNNYNNITFFYIKCFIEDYNFNLIPSNSIVNTLLYINIIIDYYIKYNKITENQYKLNHPSGSIGLLSKKIEDLTEKEFLNICIEKDELNNQSIINKLLGSNNSIVIFHKNNSFYGLMTIKDILKIINNDDINVKNNQYTIIENINTNPYTLYCENTLNQCIDKLINNYKIFRLFPVLNQNNMCIGILDIKKIMNNI